MELHFKKYYPIEYPVYQKMDVNYNIIVDMANEFTTLAKIDRNVNLIFCGSSGCMIATIYFAAIKKVYPDVKINMVYVRKKGEKSHDILHRKVDFAELNIFVDDHIYHGETIQHVLKIMRKEKMNFMFDYVAVAWITPNSLIKVKLDTHNICYSNTIN